MKWIEALRLPWRRPKKRRKSAKQLELDIQRLNLKSQNNDVSGKQMYYWLRNVWGVALAVVLGVSIYFEYWLASSVGTGKLDYHGYEHFLEIVAGVAFIQVVGICTVVVRSLFPHKNDP